MDDLERVLSARLRQPDLAVPDAVDAAVLGAGREAARAFGRRRRLRLLRVAGAVAAVVLVAAWLGVRMLGAPDRPFDVVDAWRVASGLERDSERYDLNGDGRVDRADADALLTRIVALEPRRKS